MIDSQHESQLRSLFTFLNQKYFNGILPVIDLEFSRRLKTTGGRYYWKPKRLIQISARYLSMNQGWQQIQDTLGHEMIHYWLDFLGKPCGHTPEFHRKLKDCGFARYSNLQPVGKRYIYACPGCGAQFHRRKHGVWSCGPCSGKNFNPSFLLVLQNSPTAKPLETPPEVVSL